MGVEQRHFKRVLGQRFGNCRVHLASPVAAEATLVDISVGGMKLIVEKNTEAAMASGTPVNGEVANENPAFQMSFSASVAWLRPSFIDGEAATAVGLQFKDYTPLPDALMNLIENYEAI